MADPSAEMYPELRVVEMHSRRVLRLDEATNTWQVESEDVPVSEKLNQWLSEHNMNPHDTPMISVSQFIETQTRVVIAYALCATVIGRVQQVGVELSLREKVYRLITGAAPPSYQQQQVHAPEHRSAPAPASMTVDVSALSDNTPPISPASRAFVAPAAPVR